jgi:peroxiredoxin
LISAAKPDTAKKLILPPGKANRFFCIERNNIQMAFTLSRDRWTIILIVIILIMGFEIFYLVYQNHKLRSIINDPKRYFKTLTNDDTVPAITAPDIDGNDFSLDYSKTAPHTLLYWFSSTCSSCEENIDFWNTIFRTYSSDKLRNAGMFVGSADEAREFVSKNGIEFPVLCAGQPYIVETYKGNVLPQTVFISPEGIILGVWPGKVEGYSEEELLHMLEEL